MREEYNFWLFVIRDVRSVVVLDQWISGCIGQVFACTVADVLHSRTSAVAVIEWLFTC